MVVARLQGITAAGGLQTLGGAWIGLPGGAIVEGRRLREEEISLCHVGCFDRAEKYELLTGVYCGESCPRSGCCQRLREHLVLHPTVNSGYIDWKCHLNREGVKITKRVCSVLRKFGH